jgi:hypothetical protein
MAMLSIIDKWHDGRTVMYGTAAPSASTDGTFKVGDIVWNTVPSAGSPIGWVCTTAGTPGTWKYIANVEA